MKKNHRSILDTAFCSILSAAMFFSLGVTSMAEEGNAEEQPGTEITETVEAPLPEPEPAPVVTEEEATPAEEAAPQETVTAPVESIEPEAPAPTESKEPEETTAPVPTVEAEAPAQPEETATPEPTPEVSPETTPESTPEVTPEAETAAEPTPETEEEETVIYMPAGTFSGSTSQMTVTVSYDDHTFPIGTTMRVTDVSKHEAIAAAEQSTEGDEEVIDAVAVDITFLDANNEEIQPEGAVSVSMVPYTPLETTETSTTEVIHKDDSGNVETVGNADVSASGAEFSVEHFSIYVITSTSDPAIATYIFHDADGKAISTQKVKNGETVYAPTTPEKSGYKFLGWSTNGPDAVVDPSYSGNQFSVSVSATGDVNLYPVFQQVYYVFFMDNQGRVSTTKEGVSNDEITVSDVKIPLDSTHSVTGWYTEAALTNKVDSVTLKDHNVTLYPKVEQGHYLYFASGEGASYVKPIFIAAGEKTTAPKAPTRSGYTFKHWSASEGGAAYTFGRTIEKDTTLHAVWDAKQDTTYTVIFWKQSVNDDKYAADDAKTYDYAESDIRTGSTGLTVSPSKEDQGKGYTGFTYNGSKSTSVTIKGDGTTILNVYYDRNFLTINFYRRSFGWKLYETFTGLYGQTLAKNGYSWPSEYDWYTGHGNFGHTGGTHITFLDAFISDDYADYGQATQLNLYGSNTGGSLRVNHYKQNLDGSYSYDAPANSTATGGGAFKFSNKYTGFTVNSYTIARSTPSDWDDWKPANPNESTEYYYPYNLYIRYSRNSYHLAYYNYNSVSKEEKVLFEKSLSDFSSYKPSRPDTLPEAYTFQGWFKDKECTVPFNFNSTMPSNDVVIYAKWEAPTFTGTVHTTIEGTGSPMKLAINYGSKINENDLPTVKDADGNVIQEGSSSQSVSVRKGYTWAGWATKEGDSFIIFNFNTVVYSDITLYPYYINGERYSVTYNLGHGLGTAPTDSKLYAENSYADIQPATGVKPPTGKTFLYWSNSKDDKYYPGDKVKITKNLELTAVYGDTSALTSITYHSNYPAGSGLTNTKSTVDPQANNTAIALEKADFTAPTGYYFAYWEDASGKRYDVGTNIGIDNTSANNLYAVWEQKKEITLTANSGEFTFDGTEHTVSDVETNTFTIDNVIYTVSGFTTQNPKGTNAGTYTNNILNTDSIVVKNGNTDVTYQFTVKTENGSLKITPKAVTVTADSKSKTYGAADPELTATVSGTLDNDTVSYSLSRAEGEAVGTYTITPSGKANQGNYTVSYKTGTFTISKSGSLTLTANGYEGEYDGEVHAASANASVTEGTTISYQVGDGEWTTEAPSIKDIGEQTVNVKAENANYETASATVTLRVTPKAVTVTAENKSKTYGEKDPELTATVSETLGTDTVSYTLSRAEGENVGEYAITPKGDKDQGNYTVTYVPGKLTITAADISDETMFTVSQPGDVVYNGAEQKQPVTVARVTPKAKNALAKFFSSLASLVDVNADEALKYGTDYTLTYSENLKDVGTVRVTVKGLGNYTGEVTKTYEITPAPLKVTTSSAEKVYDGKPLTAGGTLEGLVNETEKNAVKFTVKGSQTEVGSSVNSYEIVWGNIKESNYSLTKVLGTLKVTARPEPSKPKPAASSSASAPVPAPASTRFIPRTAAYPAEGKGMK
ncbi:MAG: MBG domain-containing protein [Erysipelotrichaceae bacterium]|nr:MBG domain-containing protein [Erysipelotrichaceae bacterium]